MAARNSNGTFKKGAASANPSGRPKGSTTAIRDLISDQDVQRCITMLLGIVKNPKAKHADKIKAASYIIDQAKGKARQVIDNNHIIEDIEFPEIFVQAISAPLPAPDIEDDEDE